MKLLLFIIPVLCCITGVNAQAKLTGNDGPYVFYTADSIIIKNIVRKNSTSQIINRSYGRPLPKNASVAVNFLDNKKWNFVVPLQAKLSNQPAEWPQPEKMIVLSDIEGEFQGLRRLLIANKVMNQTSNWIFGKGHLVICGDIFDRGLFVIETLWLLYKLEQEAAARGGHVHTILGNHDIMNLSGDTRYVQPKYMENAALLQVNYTALYDKNTELGRWLRTKNIVEKIGPFLFLHGGISQAVNEMEEDINELNDLARPYYDQRDLWGSDAGLDVLFAAETSPFWYRGYFTKPNGIEQVIDETLNKFQVEKIVVGHTILKTNVGNYFNGKVLGIDVNHHAFKHEGAWFEKGKWYRIDTSGKKTVLNTY